MGPGRKDNLKNGISRTKQDIENVNILFNLNYS